MYRSRRAFRLCVAGLHQRRAASSSAPTPSTTTTRLSSTYEVYGWWRFEGKDAEGVRRLGRQWVSIEELALVEDWEERVEEFEARVEALRRPFA